MLSVGAALPTLPTFSYASHSHLPGLCALGVGIDSDSERGDGASVSTSKPGSSALEPGSFGRVPAASSRLRGLRLAGRAFGDLAAEALALASGRLGREAGEGKGEVAGGCMASSTPCAAS